MSEGNGPVAPLPPPADPATSPTAPDAGQSPAPAGADEPAGLAALAARLGVPLPPPELTLAALTHKSYVNEHRGEGLTDNERLEFLGDAVIDLAVSHRLMERFPAAREGELSKIRSGLVDEAALAQIARTLDLGSLLRLGRGEELTRGREKSSLLADAFEALVAALYTAAGLAPVLVLVDRFMGEAFDRAAAGTLDRDYKTQLQELAQGRQRTSPRYRVVGERGPEHAKTFEVELELRGEVLARGEGRSKKDAEQAAARRALERWSEPPAGAPAPGEEATGAAPATAPEAQDDARDPATTSASGQSVTGSPSAPDTAKDA